MTKRKPEDKHKDARTWRDNAVIERKRTEVDCVLCGIVHYQDCVHWDYET